MAGVTLVAVPTLFTVVPSRDMASDWWRWAILVTSLLFAFFVIRASTRQAAQVDDLVGERVRVGGQDEELVRSSSVRSAPTSGAARR